MVHVVTVMKTGLLAYAGLVDFFSRENVPFYAKIQYNGAPEKVVSLLISPCLS